MGEFNHQEEFKAGQMHKAFKKFTKAMHSLNMESFMQEVLSSRRAQSDDDDDASGTETIKSWDD